MIAACGLRREDADPDRATDKEETMFSLDAFRLDDKVAIVTGAGARKNSIGEAYAKGLAAAGAQVLVADLDGDGAERVVRDIVGAGGQAAATRVDITDPASVQAMVEVARKSFGGVDILVNNAALMVEVGGTPAIGTPIEAWNRVMAVNVTGALICAQAVAPMMRERGGGKIVNQVSGGAFPASSVYGVSKIALVGLTTTLARELGRDNINVNAIAPGMTTSEAGSSLTPDESPFTAMVKMMCALRARGAPDELVGALLLLCSSAGDWISGQVLHVDGGWIIRP
jgi:NAD(P)-dependent dehydrogenase (short-subunit alcohol dehydrogenase family)